MSALLFDLSNAEVIDAGKPEPSIEAVTTFNAKLSAVKD
jgi:hypothetical protein